MIINERQGLNKPNKIYLLELTCDKELINSKSNDTEHIKTKNNDSNDKSNKNFINSHLNHKIHQQNEFNNDALKFQVLEELPQQIKGYLNNFQIREIRIIKYNTMQLL